MQAGQCRFLNTRYGDAAHVRFGTQPTARRAAMFANDAEGFGAVTDKDDLTRELRALILDSLVPLDEDELDNGSPLVDEILDSLGIAEVAVFIEEHIRRDLKPDEETRSTFASINTVVDFILANS
jgi:acyl carrier protein